MNMYVHPGRQVQANRWSPLDRSLCRTRERAHNGFDVCSIGHAYELGDMRPPCSPPCPPPVIRPETLHGGRRVVHRRVQAPYTIASMRRTGTDGRGITRTSAVVANCHHRVTSRFATAPSSFRAWRSTSLGLIRTDAVVPIWHHRMNWLPAVTAASQTTSQDPADKTENNGSADLAGPYDLHKRLGVEKENRDG